MAEEENQQQNNEEENDNNSQNTNDNSSVYSGGNKKICLGADGGCTQDHCSKIQKGLEDCGNTVTFTCIDPNQESHMQGSGADFNVFFCNGVAPATLWSFKNAIKAGTLPFTIFAFLTCAPYHNENEPDGELANIENIRKVPFEPEHDAGQFMNSSSTSSMESEKVGSGTLGEWVDQNSQYVSVCAGNSPEELAQNICSGSCGGGSSSGGTSTSSSSGGAQIKDKTFEDCIRRICAATDSVFLVENNAAVLFPYTDWMAFTLRHQIKQIKAKDMDPDLFEIDYNTDGFYNKVTVVWGADEEQDKTTSDQQNEEEEEKKGNVTTIQKTMPTGGTQLSEQYDPLVEIYGELEKKVTTNFPNEETAHFVMNALLIQYIRDFNNSCRTRVINNQKLIGGTFYAVENPNTNESELFYLNSYTMFKEKDQPLVTDIEFKYGPESAEELLDYQFYGGGSGGSVANGASNDADVPAEVKELVNQVCQGITDPYQKMVAIHNYLKDRITYNYHCCRRYNGPKECLQHMDDLNCADTTTLTVACMLAAGLDAVAVHGDFHFWTVITINGKEYASDAVSAYHDIGDVWVRSTNHGEHFNDGGPYYSKEGKMPQCTEAESPC